MTQVATSVAAPKARHTIDDLSLDVAFLRVAKIGLAKYEIATTSLADGELSIDLWTSKKGRIETVVCDAVAASEMFKLLANQGSLALLEVVRCNVHLENLTRGHYWLGITLSSGELVHVDFTTRGYLKAVVRAHPTRASIAAVI